MRSENNPDPQQTQYDQELDIRALFVSLWRGKVWIVGIAVVFALVSLGASYFMQQKWNSTAITDYPTVNNLGGYYSQQQFMRNLDNHLNAAQESAVLLPIPNEAYQEFITQAASYDTRRDFWLQTDYYKSRMENDAKADAALLDEMINNITLTPRDETKKLVNDTLTLTAESAEESAALLRRYIDFASNRAALNLNDELKGAWATRTQSLKALVKRQKMVAESLYQRETGLLKNALMTAQKQGISRSQTDVPVNELPKSQLFLLGTPMLQARLETLEATGPDFDKDYEQNIAMLSTLNVGPTLDESFRAYRYLRTPDEPIKRDSPRRAFMMIMWGFIGALAGAGVALARRRP
ncbi:MAG TPA: ECA polysaccharide chain length modulation protein [Morganella sp. (in: Bacteria)]|nr:ECA polysaccharide chain length modulation protein [Morganella sp. (in: enterobacteria)]